MQLSRQIKKYYQAVLKRFTFFDIAVFLFLCIVLLVFFIFFYRKSEYIEIRVKVTDQDVLYASTVPKKWYAERFEVGDVELDVAGREIARIVNVEKFDIASTHQVVYIDLRVKSTYDTRTKTYSTRGKAVRFGSPIRFNFSKVTFDGLVTEFPGSSDNRQVTISSKKIRALGQSVLPYLIEPVSVGDTILDSRGTELLEILAITNVPAERVTQTIYGDLLLKTDPVYRDIYFDLEVRTKIVNGEEYMFDDIPVRVNETVPINLDSVSLFPVIMEVY